MIMVIFANSIFGSHLRYQLEFRERQKGKGYLYIYLSDGLGLKQLITSEQLDMNENYIRWIPHFDNIQ